MMLSLSYEQLFAVKEEMLGILQHSIVFNFFCL